MLGQIRKRLLFTMIKNTDFLSSVNTNSFYSAATISVNVNGKQIINEGLSLGMDHEKMSVIGLQDALGNIGHSKLELRTTDNSQYVYKRLFRVPLFLDSGPRRL